MEEEKKTLEEYQKEFGVPIWVIIQAIKNGIVDRDGREHRGLHLNFGCGHWFLDNVTNCFLLSKFGHTWTFYEKKKTYAETKCTDINCAKCPIKSLACNVCSLRCENTLQEILDRMVLDDEEREFYQKRINREYKEEKE